MACSQCKGIESRFDRRQAERELKHYRQHGPDKTTRMLIAALESEGVDGLTLLDIGGGIGAVQLGLLKAGAASVTDVDASTAYLAAARSEAEREGLAGQIEYRHGDFANLGTDVAPADVVTLDRVVCCYHDVQALVGQSAAKAARLYGLVYPRDTWWTHAFVMAVNLGQRLLRSPFRVFVHPTAVVDALARRSGLAQRYQRTAGPWQVVVYARD